MAGTEDKFEMEGAVVEVRHGKNVGGQQPSSSLHAQSLEHAAAEREVYPEPRPSDVPPQVMLRVAIESKLGLWPSESRVARPTIVEPVPAKRARRRRN